MTQCYHGVVKMTHEHNPLVLEAPHEGGGCRRRPDAEQNENATASPSTHPLRTPPPPPTLHVTLDLPTAWMDSWITRGGPVDPRRWYE